MSSICYLLGHFEALDWRPLQFVNLPSTISCDLCAVIPRNVFRLECYHWLCEGCYQSVLRSNRRCPLDKQAFLESEVQTLPVRTTPLQKLEVRCCNFNHGCDFVGSLERMKSHFLKDCEFHALSCKKCCATVLSKDIISHYMEEQCGAQNTLNTSEDAGVDSNVVGIGREISASLADVTDKLRAIEDQLNSHNVGIDTTKECVVNYAQMLRAINEEQSLDSKRMTCALARLQIIAEALSRIEDEQVASVHEVMNIVISNGKRLTTLEESQKEVDNNVVSWGEDWKQRRDKLEAMPLSVGYGTNVAFFHVEAVRGLQNRAEQGILADTCSGVFVLSGYSARLGVQFKQFHGVVYIGVFLHICRGPKDSLLKWPFLLPYKLILVHPTDDKKNIENHIDVQSKFGEFPECCNRPDTSYGNGLGTPKLCKLEDALNGGFVHQNSITVAVALVERCK